MTYSNAFTAELNHAKAEVARMVDAIIEVASDDEQAHSREDGLHLFLIRAFCPDWVVAEVDRLADTPFQRWCA